MKILFTLILALSLVSISYAQTATINGIPGQSISSITNNALQNSSIALSAGCGISTLGNVVLGGTALNISTQTLVNAQTGTTYTVSSSDCGKLITFNNASTIAVTLPQATGSFGSGFVFFVQNNGAGTVTITPTTSTINGGSNIAIAQGQGFMIASDGTNYQVMLGKGSGTFVVGSNGQIVMNVAGTLVGKTIGGDCTLGTDGTLTCTKTNGTSFVASATTDTTNATNISSGTLDPARASSNETVTFTATPTFAVNKYASTITLTGNITSFTLASGTDGQRKSLTFCQNATGNFTVTAPANVHGFFTPGTTASKCSTQTYTYNAAQTAWLSNGFGTINQ